MRKNKKKNNKKGFTLVELLAVIVVLAILVLLAMPRVTTMMEKARRNSFAVEANEIVKVAQTAYSTKLLDSDFGASDAGGTTCFTIRYLIEQGYLDAEVNDIDGVVLIKMTDNNATEIKTYVSKKNYYIKNAGSGTTGKINGGNVKYKNGASLYSACGAAATTTCSVNGAKVLCGTTEIQGLS